MNEFIEVNNIKDMEEAANITCASLLPEKSKIRYYQVYEAFCKWCSIKNIQEVSEAVMLAYFEERSEILKSPASLWSEYSMLKLTISVQKNQDISKFVRLKDFLKRKNDGYQPRKSKNFKKDDIDRFIAEAPDEVFLLMKVVAIMGVAGACRTEELYRMKCKDIEFKDGVAIVKILETKNNIRRSFVIMRDSERTDWLKIVQNYIKLRPTNAVDERFFFRYERGRCVNQVVGRHTIANIPRQIAKYLQLDNVNEYTGHAFRRTSVTFQTHTYDTEVLELECQEKPVWKSNNDITVNDFDNICRTCLSRENLKPLYEKCSRPICLVDMLTACTVVKFTEDDGLPVKICINCINELNQAFSFAKRCEITDITLRKCVNNKTELENNSPQYLTDQPTMKAEDEIKIEMPEINLDRAEEEAMETYEFVAVKQEEEMIIEDEYYDETCHDLLDKNNEDTEGNRDHSYFQKLDDINSKSGCRSTDSPLEEESPKDDDNVNRCNKNLQTSPESKMFGRIFNCPICDRIYTSKALLQEHSAIHKEGIFLCNICGEIFNKKDLLNSHSTTVHPDVRPYVCHICGESFTTLAYLRSHTLIHTGKKPHVCCLCNEAFAERNNLKLHIRMHTGERPYSCGVCGKNFPSNANLIIHNRIHTGEKPYTCPFCGKGFYDVSNMKKHKQSHVEQNLVPPE